MIIDRLTPPPHGKRCQGVTGFVEPKTAHSVKPAKMREMIEKVSYEPRIELFARRKYPGWDCWGDALNKDEVNALEEMDDGQSCLKSIKRQTPEHPGYAKSIETGGV